MGNWEFDILPASLVEQELTQRDQFNNDEVGLAEALVREVIQNSSDAGEEGKQVKVCFQLYELDGRKSRELAAMFNDLRSHLDACNIGTAPLEHPSARVLVIEDFNTFGLTGRFDALEEDNFRNFWRRHGRSGKAGKSGGRWGLGKLVFSSSSEIRSFFGLTLRKNDSGALLMGQAVLANHVLNGNRHPAHGFWFSHRTDNEDRLQVPVTDPQDISRFADLTKVTRSGQTGLSIIIPYVSPSIDERSIISSVVSNYYFPILSGRLVVEVGSRVVDSKNFHRTISELAQGQQKAIPFGFVEEVSAALDDSPMLQAKSPVTYDGLQEAQFDADDLKSARQRFSNGELVHARIPVTIKPKSGEDIASHIDLYLRQLPEGERSFALIARGSITLPGEERYFRGSPAFGALVAGEENIAAFLGDAENPAHTAWNSNAEKLTNGWRTPGPTLSAIRHSLRQFHDLIAEQVETRDQNALVDFFSLIDRSQSTSARKKRTAPPKPIVEPREKAISIRARRGGFQVVPGPAASGWSFPKVVRLRMAYDMIGANPFKRHSRFDFDLMKNEIDFDLENAKIEPVNPHTLKVIVSAPDFKIEGSGFDDKRDIIVDARAAP